MDEITVFVETEIYPTENAEKVKAAVNNVLGNANITIKPSIKGSTLTMITKGQDSLSKLRNLIRNERIRDATRRLLFKSIRGAMITFYLNKQVAFAGHISFSEETAESPLGPIRVNIKTEKPQQLIEWLAEKPLKREL
jgi:predicted RNA binding protein with dsRBD fold (UPF0201 family)